MCVRKLFFSSNIPFQFFWDRVIVQVTSVGNCMEILGNLVIAIINQ